MIRITTPETEAISKIHLVGNIIPTNWYKTIIKPASENGKIQAKPHILAINILADIVYWYRNTIERDEMTAEVTVVRKKFKADLLQRSYKQLVDMFGCAHKETKEAVLFLESLGLIKRVFRTIEDKSNVMFIAIFPNQIEFATITNKPLLQCVLVSSEEPNQTPTTNENPKVGVNNSVPTENPSIQIGTHPLSQLGQTLYPNSDTPSIPIGTDPLSEFGHYTYITNTYTTTKTTTEKWEEENKKNTNPHTPAVQLSSTQNDLVCNEKVSSVNNDTNTKKEVATENVVTTENDSMTIEDKEYLMQIKLQEELRLVILSSSIANERYLMTYKSKVIGATMTDVNMLADIVASDTIKNIMKNEMIDSIEKTVKYVETNKGRVKFLLTSTMTKYLNTQNKRVSQTSAPINKNILPNIETFTPQKDVNVESLPSDGFVNGTYYAILDSKSVHFDERANQQSPNYCNLFDPTSIGYEENAEKREALYRVYKHRVTSTKFYD